MESNRHDQSDEAGPTHAQNTFVNWCDRHPCTPCCGCALRTRPEHRPCEVASPAREKTEVRMLLGVCKCYCRHCQVASKECSALIEALDDAGLALVPPLAFLDCCITHLATQRVPSMLLQSQRSLDRLLGARLHLLPTNLAETSHQFFKALKKSTTGPCGVWIRIIQPRKTKRQPE